MNSLCTTCSTRWFQIIDKFLWHQFKSISDFTHTDKSRLVRRICTKDIKLSPAALNFYFIFSLLRSLHLSSPLVSTIPISSIYASILATVAQHILRGICESCTPHNRTFTCCCFVLFCFSVICLFGSANASNFSEIFREIFHSWIFVFASLFFLCIFFWGFHKFFFRLFTHFFPNTKNVQATIFKPFRWFLICLDQKYGQGMKREKAKGEKKKNS